MLWNVSDILYYFLEQHKFPGAAVVSKHNGLTTKLVTGTFQGLTPSGRKRSVSRTWNPKYSCAGSERFMLWQSSAMKRLPIDGHPVTFRLDSAVQFFAMLATPASVIDEHLVRLRNCAFMLHRARRAASSTRSQPPTSSSVKLVRPLASAANPFAFTFSKKG